MEKKKILILANSVIGLYKFRKELLEELIKEGYSVVISCPNDNQIFKDNILNMGIEFIDTEIDRRGMNPVKDMGLFLNYLRLLKRVKPYKVLTYTIKPNLYGSLACRILKVPYINTVTGIGTLFQSESFIKRIVVYLYTLAFKKSHCVFFQNEVNKDIFDRFGIIKALDTCIVPGSGVNLKEFYPMEKTIVKEYPVFLFIGRVMKEKGIEEYIESAKNIINKGYKAEFQILGPMEEEHWKEKINEYEKQGYVKYLGMSNDVRNEIRNCDIVVNPSWHEGMSNVLLEAGAMGKVLIASDIPGCREIVIDGETGYSFPVRKQGKLEEKMEMMFNKDKKKYALEHIRDRFSREMIVKEYISKIEEVL